MSTCGVLGLKCCILEYLSKYVIKSFTGTYRKSIGKETFGLVAPP